MGNSDIPSVMDGWLNPDPSSGLPGVVNWWPDVNYLSDATSFESAADALVSGWRQHTNDGLLKPILYLYRHAAELHLKAAIQLANDCADEPFPDLDAWLRTPRKGGGHSLAALRDRLLDLLSRPELRTSHLPLGDDTPEGRLLSELHELDPRGDELRYPTRWDATSKTSVKTRMPGGADTLGASVLIDVEKMGADLAALNVHLGGIFDWLYEERYRPLVDQR